MQREPPQIDPYANDPDRWGVSMAHTRPSSCCRASTPPACGRSSRSAPRRRPHAACWSTGRPARRARGRGHRSVAAARRSCALADERPELELIRETSLDALPALPELPDAVIIDGDHNYFTVREELRLIGERAPGAEAAAAALPRRRLAARASRRLLRRRADPRGPASRSPASAAASFPGEPGLRSGGLPYPRSAAREGGPRNGVLTAVEDFVAEPRAAAARRRAGVLRLRRRLARGRAVRRRARARSSTRGTATRCSSGSRPTASTTSRGCTRPSTSCGPSERRARQEALLRRMLESSAFAVAERLSRLRMRAGVATEQSVVSHDEIRRRSRIDAAPLLQRGAVRPPQRVGQPPPMLVSIACTSRRSRARGVVGICRGRGRARRLGLGRARARPAPVRLPARAGILPVHFSARRCGPRPRDRGR